MINNIETEVLGSAFYILQSGVQVKLDFSDDEIIITAQTQTIKIHFAEIIEFNIYGPGKTVSGGGFIGGGTGVEGALIGMAASGILNAATTKISIQTVISIITVIGEIHLLCKSHEPFLLRIGLAKVFTIIRHLDTKKSDAYILKIEHLASSKEISGERLAQLKRNFNNKKFRSYGYLINSVSTEGAGFKAGIKVGDLLVKYNDKLIKSDEDLSTAIQNGHPNSISSIIVIRNSEFIKIECDSGRLGINGGIFKD